MSEKGMNFVVWTEIPVSDMARGMDFYSAVFKLEMMMDETGPNPVAMFGPDDKMGVAGHLYPGKPATDGSGPTIHLLCPDTLDATADRIKANGGEVLSPVITIPPGSFFYAQDPDGNSFGAFLPPAG